jgi:hypothetical protein
MDGSSSEFVAVLSFLLPGFVAAWVFHGLTPYPKPPQFERLIYALILTAIVNAFVNATKLFADGILWSDNGTLALAVAMAFATGGGFAFIANRDLAHRLLRRLQITRENSFPSEWYSAFSRHTSFVVLHLKGGRRLYGWPEEWPSSPDKGHFLIVDAEWLKDDNSSIELENVETVVVPVSEVEMVELMRPKLLTKREA